MQCVFVESLALAVSHSPSHTQPLLPRDTQKFQEYGVSSPLFWPSGQSPPAPLTTYKKW